MEYPVASRQSHTGTPYSQLQPNNAPQSSYSSGPGLSSGGSSGIGPPHSDFMAYRQQSDYAINSPQIQSSSYPGMQVGSGPLSAMHPDYDYHNRGPPAQHQRPGLYNQSSAVGKFNSLRQPSADLNATSETLSQMQHLPSHSYYDQASQNWPPSQQPPNYMSPHGHNNSECLGPSSHHLHKMYYENQVGPGYGGSQGSHYNMAGNDVPPPTLGKSEVLPPSSSSAARYNPPYPSAQFQQTNYGPSSQSNEQSVEQVTQPHWGAAQNHYMQGGGREVRHQPLPETPMSPNVAVSSAGDASYVGRPGSVDSGGATPSNFQMVACGSAASGSTDDERPLSRISEPSTPRSAGLIPVAPIYVSATAAASAISSQHSTSPAISSPQANSPMPQQMFMAHSQSHPQYSHSPQASTSHVVQASSRNTAYASAAGGGKPVYSGGGGGAFTPGPQSHGMIMPQQSYPVRNASQSMYTVHQRPPHSYGAGGTVPYGYQGGVASSGPLQNVPYGTPPGLQQNFVYGPPPPNSGQMQVPGATHCGRMMGPPPPIDQYRGSPNPPLRRPLPPGSSAPLYPVMNSGSPFESQQSAVLSMNGRGSGVKSNDSVLSAGGSGGNFRSSGGSDDAQSLTPVNQMSPSHSSQHDDDSLMSNPMTPVANSVCPTSVSGNSTATSTAQHKLYAMGDEPDRCAWVERYLLFMDEIGRPLSNLPQVAKHPLDLYRLYIIVREYGGLMQVIKCKRWKEISKYVNISASASGTCTLRKNYIKYLLDFECRFDRDGTDPRPIIAQIEGMSSKKKKSDSAGSGTVSSTGAASLPQESTVSPLNNLSESLPSQSSLMQSSINGVVAPSSIQSQRQFAPHPGYPQSFPMPPVNQPGSGPGPAPPAQNMTSHNGAALPSGFAGAPPPSWSSPAQHYNYPLSCQAPSRLPLHATGTLPPGALLQGPTQPSSIENLHGHPSNSSSLHGHQPNSVPPHYMNQGQQYLDSNHTNFTSSNGFQPGMHLTFNNAFPHKDAHIPANHQIRQLQQLVHNQVPLSSSTISSSMTATHTADMTAPHLSLTAAAAATAAHLQHQHLSETSAATQHHRSSALLGMLISDQRHASSSSYPQWPGYASSGPLGASGSLRSDISHSLPSAQFGQHTRGNMAAHGAIISPPSSHLQGLHSMEAQLRQRFGVDQLPQSRHQQMFFHHQSQHQDAELMLQYHQRLSEHHPTLDANKLEGTEIHSNVARRRLTPKDLGAVNPWRMYMGLKSGLACEGTRALNTLNIILADTEALSYMSLMRLPGLLETLVELWRRSLIELFPMAAFHDLEISPFNEEKKAADTIYKDNDGDDDDDDYVGDDEEDNNYLYWSKNELLLRMRCLRSKTGNFTFRTRCGRRVKLDMVRSSRARQLAPNQSVSTAATTIVPPPWQNGLGDTTRHIVTVQQQQQVLHKRRYSSAASDDDAHVAAAKRMHADVDVKLESEESSEETCSNLRQLFHSSNEVYWRAPQLNQRVFNLWPDEVTGQHVARCCAISTALRNLSFLSTNEAELCAHAGLLRLLACLLLYLENEVKEKEEETSLVPGGAALQADALVLLTNIAGQLDLMVLPDTVVRPLLDAVVNSLCRHAAWATCHRLALECLARLSVHEYNVELLLALRPWTRLERLLDVLCQHLAGTAPEDQVCRELALSVLSYVVRGGSGSAALYTARANPKPVPLLIDLVETAETAAIHIAQTQGVAVLRERPELMGTSLHMLRRAAITLNTLAQVAENTELLRCYQPRLLLLVMSQILDQQVAAMLADALFLVSKDSESATSDVITTVADALVKVESNEKCVDPVVIQSKHSPLEDT